MSKSRGHHRGHEEHEEHEEHVNHEAWVIPYADMLTLLMALFLVLFAVGRTDLEKFKKLAQSFRQEFGNSSTEVVDMGGSGESPSGDGGSGVLAADVPPTIAVTTSSVPTPADEALGEKEAAQQAAVAEADSLEEVKEAVQAAADQLGIGDSLNLTLDARGLVVTIVTDRVLFLPGDAQLQPEGVSVLDVVGQALLNVPNQISIEGHTDNRPISNSRYADNWDLSNARATSVLRFFLEHDGIPAARLTPVGHADTMPIADNSTPEGQARNRRVEVIVKAQVSLAPIVQPDGHVDPGVTTASPTATTTASAADGATAGDDATANDGAAADGGAAADDGADDGSADNQPAGSVPADNGAVEVVPPGAGIPSVKPDLSPGIGISPVGGASGSADGQ